MTIDIRIRTTSTDVKIGFSTITRQTTFPLTKQAWRVASVVGRLPTVRIHLTLVLLVHVRLPFQQQLLNKLWSNLYEQHSNSFECWMRSETILLFWRRTHWSDLCGSLNTTYTLQIRILFFPTFVKCLTSTIQVMSTSTTTEISNYWYTLFLSNKEW